jgi:hypothetical protein
MGFEVAVLEIIIQSVSLLLPLPHAADLQAATLRMLYSCSNAADHVNDVRVAHVVTELQQLG